ncbi:MAG: MFS transporter [Alphaproteobacteria bacterium]|nr:MFS transporter [Alphaproteobacteria bacterium]
MPSSATGAAVLIVLGILTAFGPMSMDMYLPALPELVEFFWTTPGKAQLTLSAFTIAFGAGQLVYGPVSDRMGRRNVLLVGVAIYSLASILCVFASTINEMILARSFKRLAVPPGLFCRGRLSGICTTSSKGHGPYR